VPCRAVPKSKISNGTAARAGVPGKFCAVTARRHAGTAKYFKV